MKLTTRLKRNIQKAWANWKLLVDWFETNARYLTAILRLLTSRPILMALVFFGVLATDTADTIKESVGMGWLSVE